LRHTLGRLSVSIADLNSFFSSLLLAKNRQHNFLVALLEYLTAGSHGMVAVDVAASWLAVQEESIRLLAGLDASVPVSVFG